MKNIFEQLTDLLKKDERLVSHNGVLLKNQAQELARKNDPALLKLLLSDKTIKQHFFFEVEKTLIFDKEKFIRFVSNKQFLPDSYTAFKNKIGLTAGDEYVSENKEVVLAWPYKDCVLEGGMTKEDQKRDEIFYNETLAPDDINRLLDAKVFTNFKRIDKKGEHKLDGFNRNEKGIIKDNLIIKGNNLLALASLKKEFAGKVKLIYIDPPYNTGNDGFKYNDSFNHSSWLVFMKNRLEIAKQLLRNDGLIFVQADYNEAHYLKILLDEVFGREKFVNEIIWKRKFGTANETRRFATAFDNIYLYSKTENYTINLIREKDTKHVQEYIKARFTRKDSIGPHAGRLWMPYPLANPGKPTKNLIYEYKGYSAPPKGWRVTKETLEKFDKEGRLYFPEDKKQRIQEKKFLDEYAGQPVDALWTDIFVINSQSDEALEFDGQKPEDLLRRIILIGSNENDIVLDYHAGTGTTLAVAHKTGRQYIGIEQMDYIHELPEARLKKVIAGEQGGISKAVKWQGGGDFVYIELAKWNEEWIEKIRDAKTGKELAKLWGDMKETAFLSYKVEPKMIDANAKDFAELSIADQKKFLIECLDKNQLYINLSEIEDKEYGVSKEDIKLNKEFYE